MMYEIVSIGEQHISGFWAAVDSVAQETKSTGFGILRTLNKANF